MKRFTHVRCLENVEENGIILFRKNTTYRILGTDNSYIFYIESESDEDNLLTDEFAISLLDNRFKFLVID